MTEPKDQVVEAKAFVVLTINRRAGRAPDIPSIKYLNEMIDLAWRRAAAEGRQDEFEDAVHTMANGVVDTLRSNRPKLPAAAASRSQPLRRNEIEFGLNSLCPLWPFC